MRTAGVVLCGGHSSRMGAPKAWLAFGAETILARVVRVVGDAVGPVVVVAAPGQDVPPLPAGVRVVRDAVEGQGPLGGLAAGMTALAGEADVVYLSSCDVPLLTAAFVRAVIASSAVPFAHDRLHPLAAAYALSALPIVREHLAAGRLRMTDLLDRLGARRIEAHELPDLDSLRNVNTPDEYAAALSALRTS